MFAFKSHNPYQLTWKSDVDTLRGKIEEFTSLSNETLEKCNEFEQNWITYKVEIEEESK